MVPTVLVIDGEVSQREPLCNAIREAFSYQILSMTSVADATRHILTEAAPRADIILFDLSAGPNGYEITTSLKILSAHMPVIALVKYGDYETASQAMNAGAQDFLTKPAAIERLRVTLRNALLWRDLKREAEWLRRGALRAEMKPSENGSHALPFSFTAEDGHVRSMEMLEAEAIRFAMQRYNGRMTEVARRLGIGRSTLYRKLNDLSLKEQQAA